MIGVKSLGVGPKGVDSSGVGSGGVKSLRETRGVESHWLESGGQVRRGVQSQGEYGGGFESQGIELRAPFPMEWTNIRLSWQESSTQRLWSGSKAEWWRKCINIRIRMAARVVCFIIGIMGGGAPQCCWGKDKRRRGARRRHRRRGGGRGGKQRHRLVGQSAALQAIECY